MNKKIFLIIVVIILLGCSQKKEEISLFIYNNKDPFISSIGDKIEAKTKNKFNITRYDSQNFQITQNEIIDEILLKQNSLILLNPVDRLGVYPIIKKFKSKNIPVIFFNREPLKKDLELWEKAYYVGTKSEQAGIIQAELIDSLFNSKENFKKNDRNSNNYIDVVFLKGEQGHQDSEIRTTEVLNSLKNRGYNINILTTVVANWSRSQAYELMKNIISDYKNNMDLIISNNDEMAIGAIKALTEAKLIVDKNNNNIIERDNEQWIPVVGIDGLSEAKDLIKRGFLYGTVVNDSESQAEAIVELAEAILKNKSLNELSNKIINDKYILINYKILQ